MNREIRAFSCQPEPIHKLERNFKRKGVSRKEETGYNYSRKDFCNLKRKKKKTSYNRKVSQDLELGTKENVKSLPKFFLAGNVHLLKNIS